MLLNTLLCGALATLVAAGPVEQRATKSVYVTSAKNWGGLTASISVENNVVYSWSQKDPFHQAYPLGAASFGPDAGM